MMHCTKGVEAFLAMMPPVPAPAARRARRWLAGVVLMVGAALIYNSPARAAPSDAAMNTLLARLRDDPLRLEMFLRTFPKGADLHNHLAGAPYAEDMLAWAADDHLCVSPSEGRILPGLCVRDIKTGVLAAEDLPDHPDARSQLIDALSMRDFIPTPRDRSGHDHFFEVFSKFSAVSAMHAGDMLADTVSSAAADHVVYLELMISPGRADAVALGKHHPLLGDDFRGDLSMLQSSLPALVAAARQATDRMEQHMHQALGCGTGHERPGCEVAVRYLYAISRTTSPSAVFAQTALGYALAHADPRFVGVNLVMAEDDPVALRGYDEQMRVFHFFAQMAPTVGLSLHAGELTEGLTPISALRDHIWKAVEIAGARRIGHGVDIAYEDDPSSLLAMLAARQVLIEINLTSNQQILGVIGRAHPFGLYRAAHVPVALSTDDEGVSRIDLTHEYVQATRIWSLDYTTLRDLSRASLEFAFVPGHSLWSNKGSYVAVNACRHTQPLLPLPTGACRDYLAINEKARFQWLLERRLAAFEERAMHTRGGVLP